MRIKISTIVNATLDEVQYGFNKDLFLKLSPPFPKVELQVFEGSEVGNLVSLQLNFLLFKQNWTSEIVQEFRDSSKWQFVDKGVELPFFLKSWTHHHNVEVVAGKTVITDDITYDTGNTIANLIVHPLMVLQFLYRKPIYKSFFGR